jgi:serine/threonine-protein kinase
MELLNGTDLASKLRTETNRLPSDELVVLLDHVARALEVARLAGVVHRDLKPHNLFLHGGTWKVLDFGVSKLMGSEGTLTGEGIVGTPQYMAPEQASGGHVTHLADVYALGAIAYRCLTGRTPFKGKDLAELVYQVVHSAPIRPGLLGQHRGRARGRDGQGPAPAFPIGDHVRAGVHRGAARPAACPRSAAELVDMMRRRACARARRRRCTRARRRST